MNRFLQISRHLHPTKQRNLESQYSRQGGKGFAAVSNLGQVLCSQDAGVVYLNANSRGRTPLTFP